MSTNIPNNLMAAFKEKAAQVVDEKTGALKTSIDAEVKAQLERIEADLDRKIDTMKAEVQKSRVLSDVEKQAEDMEARKAFKNVIVALGNKQRPGRDLLEKATGYTRFDLADQGVLLAPDFIQEINRKAFEFNDVLSVVKRRDTDRPEVTEEVITDNLALQWRAEATAATRQKSESAKVKITLHAGSIFSVVTEEKIEDNAYDFVAEWTQNATEAIAAGLGTAIMTGTGAGQPQGMIGKLQEIDSSGLTLTAPMVIRLQGEIKGGYLRDNASSGWLMDRQTRSVLRRLSQASNSNLFWEVNGQAGNPERLMGYPVYEAPTGVFGAPSAAGAYTSGQRILGFGNWYRAYTVAIRPQMKLMEDPYSLMDSGEIRVIASQRMGGEPTNLEAAKFLKASS